MSMVATGITHDESRVLEQGLICAYTLEALNNSINSIARNNWNKFDYEVARIPTLLGGLEK